MTPGRRVAPVFLLLFIDMICQGMSFPTLPTLIGELSGATLQGAAQKYGLMLGGYAFAELFGAPVLGLLSDRFGRRPVLLLSGSSAAASYAVTALAPTWEILFLGYFLAGLTSAMMVVTNAVIADVFPVEERAKGYSWIGAVFGLGFVVGPAVGALIAPLGLRAPFFLSTGLMALATLGLAFTFRESKPVSVEAPSASLNDFMPWKAFGALAKAPLAKKLTVTVFFNALAMQMLIAVWVPFCTAKFGFGVVENGWVLALFGLAMALSQALVVPAIISRLGERRSLAIGLVASVLTYLGYALAPTVALFLLVLFLGAFGALDEPSIQSLATADADPEQQGALQGSFAVIGSLMGVIGPSLGGMIFSLSSGPRAPIDFPGMTFVVGGALVAVGAVPALAAIARRRA
jgi:DHA1 family tetracycline resistance protein-like MFS transporter